MSAKKQLQRELAALQHELRRINDGLERNPTRALQQRARQLRESIALCQQDLERLSPSPDSPSSSE